MKLGLKNELVLKLNSVASTMLAERASAIVKDCIRYYIVSRIFMHSIFFEIIDSNKMINVL